MVAISDSILRFTRHSCCLVTCLPDPWYHLLVASFIRSELPCFLLHLPTRLPCISSPASPLPPYACLRPYILPLCLSSWLPRDHGHRSFRSSPLRPFYHSHHGHSIVRTSLLKASTSISDHSADRMSYTGSIMTKTIWCYISTTSQSISAPLWNGTRAAVWKQNVIMGAECAEFGRTSI